MRLSRAFPIVYDAAFLAHFARELSLRAPVDFRRLTRRSPRKFAARNRCQPSPVFSFCQRWTLLESSFFQVFSFAFHWRIPTEKEEAEIPRIGYEDLAHYYFAFNIWDRQESILHTAIVIYSEMSTQYCLKSSSLSKLTYAFHQRSPTKNLKAAEVIRIGYDAFAYYFAFNIWDRQESILLRAVVIYSEISRQYCLKSLSVRKYFLAPNLYKSQ